MMKNVIYNEFPIQTYRLYVKKIEIEELLAIRNNTTYEEENRMTCRPIIKRNEIELKEFYEKILKNDNIVIFSIIRKLDGILLGKISFSDYNLKNNSIEIGYYLIREFRGNGYMKEAIKYVCDILFNQVKLNKIYAQTASFNYQSINMLKSLNFKKDGVLREHHELNGEMYDDYIFSILNKEFKW